ncbi:MAG TPA: 3'-5' exonuclease [Clostridia bacterium]|mgnify:CR=1 FL=1|nr:3'-5' exonuclease [Clostridia bacterium]
MNYLFFDIECANCDNGVGKICSFGYVLCDSEFNIIEKKDILINPDAEFSYGVFNKKYITLAYPRKEFLNKPKFDELYPVIKDILMREDQLVLGHAVDNDVNFLLGDCDRYRLPIIEYDFYDSQELYRAHTKSALHKNLSAICEELNITLGNAHRSDDDAEMTMHIVKTLCRQNNLTLPELLERYPSCHHKMRDLVIKHNLRKQYFLFRQYLLCARPEKREANGRIKGKTICFSRKIEALDYGKAAKLIQHILDGGGDYTTDPGKADIFVRGRGGCDRFNKATALGTVAIMTLTAFCKLLDVNYSLLPPLNMQMYVFHHQKTPSANKRRH